ncbi:MAG: rhodanese-like domain-containing protein, partial [Euryarchaeota archaeon]|nr:rhodanese-like domain-containing protein [Euryarchaeota archaeon]
VEYHSDGRIPGARLIPINELQYRLRELDPGKKYLVYCRTGNRSGQVLCRFLSGLGFKNVYNQAGGVVQWSQYGLPLEGGRAVQRAPGVFYS